MACAFCITKEDLFSTLDPSLPATGFYIFFSIFLTAFFVGSKNALLGLNNSTIAALEKSKNFIDKRILMMIRQPRRLMLTVVSGQTIFIALTSIFSFILAVDLSWALDMPFGYRITLVLVIILGLTIVVIEIVGKQLVERFTLPLARAFALPFNFFFVLLLPLSSVLKTIMRISAGLIGLEKSKYDLSEEDLRLLVDADSEGAALQKDEREMIHSIFEMGETTAREIMVPRIDMVCAEDTASLSQILALLKDKNHSRLPIYKGTVDNIVGILHIKDLIPLIKKRSNAAFDVMKIANEAYFVPEQKKVNELLREFRMERIHMAIVVDEYGGTSGLVTLEDVIEEIVGEIQDEHDHEAPQINQIDDHTYLVNGSMLIDDLNDEHHFNLPSEDGIDTLAGFLLGQFGAVPKTKSKIFWKGYEFIVERVYRRRIERVRVIRHPELENNENGA